MKKLIIFTALFYASICFAAVDTDSLVEMPEYLSPWSTKAKQDQRVEKDLKKYRKRED